MKPGLDIPDHLDNGGLVYRISWKDMVTERNPRAGHDQADDDLALVEAAVTTVPVATQVIINQ